MAYISACTSLTSRLITGLTTVWGEWNSSSGSWDNLQSLYTIGNMSGLQEFDDNAAMRTFKGNSFTLTPEQDVALMELWYSEASPNQKEHYENQSINSAWSSTREAIFDEEDLNSDGVLNYDEAFQFLLRVRPLDGKTLPTDEKKEKIDRAWNFVKLLSGQSTSMSFSDYEDMEKGFEAFYANGKLEATGHARGTTAGDDLSHHCITYTFDDQDEIKLAQITSSEEGVSQVTISTSKKPTFDLGIPDSNSDRYAYPSTNWANFDFGNTLYGLYGTTNTDGDLNSLGFIRKDLSCY